MIGSNTYFNNKNIIVTGASTGIGMSTAILLHHLGATVHLIARNKAKLDLVNKEIGNSGFVYAADLADVSSIEEIVRKIIINNGPVDGFVHCAGVGGARPLNLLRKTDIEKFMDINFYAFIEMTRCLSKKGHFGNNFSIVAMSSIASVMGDKGKIAYCASKAALDASIRCLAKELAVKNIRVNSIRASWVKTGLYNKYVETWGDTDNAKEFIKRHYLGVLDTDDIGHMIAFLLSDNSKHITGTSILIDSGCMA